MRTSENIVTSGLVMMIIIGLFGNANVLIATIRKKKIYKRKNCCLVGILTVLQTCCLLYELVVICLNLRFRPASRSSCFKAISFYMFCILAQSMMFFVITLDIILAVKMPIKHRLWSKWPYVISLSGPTFLYAGIIILLTYLWMDDQMLSMCNPILALPPLVERIVSYTTLITNVCCLGMLVAVLSVIFQKDRGGSSLRSSRRGQKEKLISEEKKAVRALGVLTMVFLCSWCVCVVAQHVAHRYLSRRLFEYVQTWNILLALPTYCQTAFVVYFRSPNYKAAFKEHLSWFFHGKPNGTGDNVGAVDLHTSMLEHTTLDDNRKVSALLQFSNV